MDASSSAAHAQETPQFKEIKLAEPAPAWLTKGDVVMLAPAGYAERMLALEFLWAAIKELNADGTGYTPKMAEAVARLRKLEAGQ